MKLALISLTCCFSALSCEMNTTASTSQQTHNTINDHPPMPNRSVTRGHQNSTRLSASDLATGIIVYVAADEKTVIAKDRNAKVLWKQNILEACGTPNVGSPIIRHLLIQKGGVQLVYGKHNYVLLSLLNGRILSTASD